MKLLSCWWRLFPRYDYFLCHARGDAALYAHALEAALRERGLRVFLDWTQAPPGQELTPTLHRALLASRSLLLIESPLAPTRPWVRTEVRFLRKLGRDILPVRASHEAGDPFGLGTEVIRIEERAPWGDGVPSSEVADQVRLHAAWVRAETRRRALIGSTVLVLLAAALWLYLQAGEIAAAARRVLAATVQGDLQADAAGQQYPTDLARYERLEAMRTRAVMTEDQKLVDSVNERLAVAPAPAAATSLLPSGERCWLAVSTGGTTLLVAGGHTIELRDPATGSVRSTIDLRGLSERAPAVFVEARVDRWRDRVVVAVRYESFHDRARAERVVGKSEGSPEIDGDQVHGSEIELCEVLPAEGRLAPLELLTELVYTSQHDLENEEHGTATWEPRDSGEDAWLRSLARPSTFLPSDLPRDRAAYEGFRIVTVGVSVAGSDARDNALVLSISEQLSSNDQSYAERIYAVIVQGSACSLLVPPVDYRADARHLSAVDQPDLGRLFVASRPSFDPAVASLRCRHAFLDGRFVDWSRTPSLVFESETSVRKAMPVRFTDDGALLLSREEDGSWLAAGFSSGQPMRRFLVTDPTIVASAPSADGRHMFLMRRSGAVEIWDWEMFGPDGWLRRP